LECSPIDRRSSDPPARLRPFSILRGETMTQEDGMRRSRADAARPTIHASLSEEFDEEETIDVSINFLYWLLTFPCTFGAAPYRE